MSFLTTAVIATFGISGIISQLIAKKRANQLKKYSYDVNMNYLLINGTVSKLCPKTTNESDPNIIWTQLSVYKNNDYSGRTMLKQVNDISLPYTIMINNYPLVINSNTKFKITKAKYIIPISIAQHYFKKNCLIVPVDYYARNYEVSTKTLLQYDHIIAITNGNTIIAITDKFTVDDCLEEMYGYSPIKIILFGGLLIVSVIKFLLT